jgi:hypothetical protein
VKAEYEIELLTEKQLKAADPEKLNEILLVNKVS